MDRPDDGTPWHLGVGAFWGAMLGFLTRYLNERYEVLFGDPETVPLWAAAGLLFFLLSLLLAAIIVVLGAVQALRGRFRLKRWGLLLTAVVCLIPGNFFAGLILSPP